MLASPVCLGDWVARVHCARGPSRVLACTRLGVAGHLGGTGAPCSVRAPLALSLRRSFSSMSDITGKGPGTPWGGLIWGLCCLLCPWPASPSLRLCCPLAGQGGSAWEALGELLPTSHPEPTLVLSPGPGCALWGSSIPACPPPSSGKLKGHPGQPGPSPEPRESNVFQGPQTCQIPRPLGHGPSQGLRGSTRALPHCSVWHP